MRNLLATVGFAAFLTGCAAEPPTQYPAAQPAAASVGTTSPHESDGDTEACEALWNFYTKLDRPSSDAEGGSQLRVIAQRAATEQVRAAIIEDARLWETGSNEWGPGTEVCNTSEAGRVPTEPEKTPVDPDAVRDQVLSRAEAFALHVTTFEGASIEAWLDEARANSTGKYARQFTELFDQELKDALRDQEVESVGAIQRSFVQMVEGDRAEVFLIVDQTIVNATTSDPVVDELRMDMKLRREGDSWLAADVAVLGPSGAKGD